MSFTATVDACGNGHTSLVRHLVTKYSCDLNARDRNGDTPFICAGLGGSVECLELLINAFHCDINTKDSVGRTILHYACTKGHTSLVRHLVTKYSCDLNARDSKGETPFTNIGLSGSVECLELLINDFTATSTPRVLLVRVSFIMHVAMATPPW